MGVPSGGVAGAVSSPSDSLGSDASIEAAVPAVEPRIIKMCDKCFRNLQHYPRIDHCHWVYLNCAVCRGDNVKLTCEFKVSGGFICGGVPGCPRC